MAKSSRSKTNAPSKRSSSAKSTSKTKGPKRSSAPAKEPTASKRGRSRSRKREETEEELEDEDKKSFFTGIVGRSSSWTTSLILHMAIIIILAYMYLPTPEVLNTLISGAQSEDISEDPVDVPDVDFDTPELEPEETELQPETDLIAEEISDSPFDEELASAMNMEVPEFGVNAAPNVISDSMGFDGHGFEGRGKAARAALVASGGGNADSELAVVMALDWLAEHQNPDGTWHLDFRGGNCNGQCKNPGEIKDSLRSATALALLPYLGYGQTRFKGKYKNVVGKGLNALVRMGQKPKRGNGVSWADGGNMYAHGIAAIALCEAYGMTKDSQLQDPAQAALNYIVSAQNPNDGGWRYSYQQAGDTSVVGWQVAALKSGHLGGLQVPPNTIKGAIKFLDLAQNGEYGDAYAYTTENKQNYRKSMSAVGLLCRMYMGWSKDHQGIVEGATKLAKVGPSKSDFYYNYYASQVIFQYTNGKGPMWRQWNEELRDYLVASQGKQGHEKGSWYVRGSHASHKGGRLYMTCMATMNLEVYYRIMPIYQTDAVEEDFPE